MAKLFLYLILLCSLATVDASEVQYIIRPSQSRFCSDQYSSASCVDNDLTLSQFVDNFSNYLANHTTLIFSPGNYNLESELVVENVRSFSMFAWPGSSSMAVITCGHNARFEFRNVTCSVTVSGLEFEGCFENQVISVGHFQLENSAFLGGDQALFNGTVLSIVESVASLERVVFLSILDALPDLIEANCTAEHVVSITTNKMAGIFMEGSSVSITHSQFEGNNVGLFGGLIVDELGSNVTLVDTTFINNRAESYANLRYECNITSSKSSIVYANGHGSTVKIHDSKFERNIGAIIFGRNCTMLITHTNFISNRHVDNTRPFGTVYSIAGLVILSGSSLIDNTGPILDIRNANMNLSHSEFIGNQNLYATVSVYGGKIASIDHSQFINNTGFLILRVSNTDVISVTHSEFVDNTVTASHAVIHNGLP